MTKEMATNMKNGPKPKLGAYKQILENKAVDVDRIRGRSAAEQVIREAVQLYRDRITPPRSRPGASHPN